MNANLWAWFYTIGFAAYVVLAITIIPLGARDMIRMFRQLREEQTTDESTTQEAES